MSQTISKIQCRIVLFVLQLIASGYADHAHCSSLRFLSQRPCPQLSLFVIMASTVSAPEENEEENPYLALRRANIARNETKLRELGLLNKVPNIATPKSRKRPIPERSTDAGFPTRRSKRLKSQDDSASATPKIVKAIREDEAGKVRKPTTETARKKPKTAARQQSSNLNPHSARLIELDTHELVFGNLNFLGKPMHATGKAAVMETSASMFTAMGESSERISFNKYCGVQEWKRGIFLWVNLGAKGNEFVNDFLDGGRRMTWYGGSRMHEDSPVIQRLVSAGRKALENPEQTSNAIILWCRQYQADKKTFGPYHCLGRLAYSSHEPGSMPVSFVWTLLDFDRLVEENNEAITKMIGSL